MCVQNFTYMYISFHFPQRCHMWFTLPLCVSLQKSDQIFDLLPLAVLDWNSLSPLLSLVYSVCLSVCLSNCLFLSLFSPFFTIYHLLFVTDILSLSLSHHFFTTYHWLYFMTAPSVLLIIMTVAMPSLYVVKVVIVAASVTWQSTLIPPTYTRKN